MTHAPTAGEFVRRRGWERAWFVVLVVLALALALGATLAQPASSAGTTVAVLALTGRAELGAVARLQLGASQLTFDLQRPLGEPDVPACVTSSAPDRSASGDFGLGTTVAPAGTTYRSLAWPAIEIVGGTPLTAFPPPSGDRDLAVVCYRSFVLEPFANVDGWQLVVTRIDSSPATTSPPLYLTGTCRGEPDAGLQPLADGGRIVLASDRVAGSCGAMLAILAVRVDRLAAGETVAELQYTLLAADADFSSAPEVRP